MPATPAHVAPLVIEGLQLGRVAVGAALLARPGLVPGVLGVDAAASSHLGWALQMLGAREVALGLGGVAAGRAGSGRLWLQAGLFSDAVDALAVAAAVGSGRVRRGTGAAVVALAVAAVAAQAAALGRR